MMGKTFQNYVQILRKLLINNGVLKFLRHQKKIIALWSKTTQIIAADQTGCACFSNAPPKVLLVGI